MDEQEIKFRENQIQEDIDRLPALRTIQSSLEIFLKNNPYQFYSLKVALDNVNETLEDIEERIKCNREMLSAFS